MSQTFYAIYCNEDCCYYRDIHNFGHSRFIIQINLDGILYIRTAPGPYVLRIDLEECDTQILHGSHKAAPIVSISDTVPLDMLDRVAIEKRINLLLTFS